MLKSERSIFDDIQQVEEGVMRASRLMRLGWRSQKEAGQCQNIKLMLNQISSNRNLQLLQPRSCTSSSALCFSRISRYAPETAEPNLTHICDSDFNIFIEWGLSLNKSFICYTIKNIKNMNKTLKTLLWCLLGLILIVGIGWGIWMLIGICWRPKPYNSTVPSIPRSFIHLKGIIQIYPFWYRLL